MALSDLPQLVVEFAPASTPSATSPTWVDISSFVRSQDGVTIRRGRQSESSTFNPGSATLVLNNRKPGFQRIFDPRHATGTYFGNLKPRKQIRLRALWNAVYYPLFQGFIAGWPQEYRGAKEDGVVPITAYDALAVLAETAQPDVYANAAAAVATPKLLLNQFNGVLWSSTPGYGSAPITSATGVSTSSGLAPGLASNSGSFAIRPTSSLVNYFSAPFTRTAASDWSFSMWFQAAAESRYITYLLDTVNGTLVSVTVESDSTVKIVNWSGWTGNVASSTLVATSDTVLSVFADARPHHLVVVYPNATKTVAVYIDGVAMQTTQSGPFNSCYPDTFGSQAGTTGTANGSALIQAPVFWSTALTGTQVATLYQNGSGYLEETTGARFTRLLDNIAHPAALRDLTTNPKGTCGTYTPQGRTTLAELQTLAATEQGRIFVSKDGLVTMHGRYHYLEVTRGKTVQATFSDDGADIKYQAVGTDFSDREVANDITVSASRSASANAQDATSITDYGLQSRPITTVLSTQSLADDMARGLLLHAKDAVTRTSSSIDVRGVIQTAKWPTILGLEIGDRVKHEITPFTGSQAVLELLTEGISWRIKRDDWIMSLDAVPVPGGGVAGNTFLVGDDATFGVLDTGRAGF